MLTSVLVVLSVCASISYLFITYRTQPMPLDDSIDVNGTAGFESLPVSSSAALHRGHAVHGSPAQSDVTTYSGNDGGAVTTTRHRTGSYGASDGLRVRPHRTSKVVGNDGECDRPRRHRDDE